MGGEWGALHFFKDPRPGLDAREELFSRVASGLLYLASLDNH